LIGVTPFAERQLDDLQQHYTTLQRPDALRRLIEAVEAAMTKIERHPDDGLPAPRPYPELARPGRAWVKAGRYWVSYQTTRPLVITGIFFDAADIPHRGE
jgi:plasmid stabilization system protein ParE